VSKFKKLLIPAIVLVVLVGGLLVVTNLPEPEVKNPEPKAEVIQIFDFVKDDVTEIQIENKAGIMRFQYVATQVEEEITNEDGTTETKLVDRKVWQAIEPADMQVNSGMVDSIAWNSNTLKAQKLIEENPTDLALYGLNDPVKVTFKMKDGTNHVLHVGNETPTGGAYYAKKENEPKVYTIGSYEGGKYLQTKLQLMETDLYDKAYTQDDVTVINYSRKGEKLFDSNLSDKKWWLTYPIQAEAKYENLYAIAESLAGATLEEYVEENAADLSKYGLAKPSYVFEYMMGGKQYKLMLGNKSPSGSAYYAMLNDNNLVFTIADAAFTFLDKPIEEIVSTFIHLQNITEVSKLVVTFDGRTDVTHIKFNQEDDELSVYNFNGIELTGEKDEDYIKAFKKYYQGAIGFYVDKLELDATPVLQNPEVTVVYTLNSGEEIKVEMVPAQDGVYFYAFKNGQYTGMKVRKKQMDDESYKGIRLTRKLLDEKLAERTGE
jgi:hypothetical protein